MPKYYESLDKENKDQYDKKLTLADGQKLPDPLSLTEWGNDVTLLPDVNWPDIYNYLINSPSEYTYESMKAYKSLTAYEYFICGHVQDVFYNEIDKKNNFCFIKSKVNFLRFDV